jgi:hypothetical protein
MAMGGWRLDSASITCGGIVETFERIHGRKRREYQSRPFLVSTANDGEQEPIRAF